MAIAHFSTAKIDPQGDYDITVAATGGTVVTGNVLTVAFDNTAFTSEEGRIRLALALERIAESIKTVKQPWPVT